MTEKSHKDDDGEAEKPAHHEHDVGGAKTIGFWGGVCLLANNITGPGMVQIPVMYAQAGWLFPTLALLWAGLLSGITSLVLAKAVSQVPGNKHLALRVEFGNIAKLLFPRWLYLLVFFTLIFNFQISNISSIVVSAQTMDSTILAGAGKTCAIVMWSPDTVVNGTATHSSWWRCVGSDDDHSVTDSLFGGDYVISIGFLVTLAITVPLGFLNLDSNIWVQYGGFFLLLGCIIAWMVQFIGYSGLTAGRMPAIVADGLGTVIPTVMFNWSFLITVPSWLNEKNPAVSVAKSTWMAIIISGAMFIALGVFGALAMDFPNGEDLLAAIDDPGTPRVLLISKIATYVFPSAALLSGIPVFSIIVRYNLLENRICGPKMANFFAVLFPWGVSLAFFAGNALSWLIQWSSSFLFVELNFVLPLYLYVRINSAAGRAHLVHMLRDEHMPLDDAAGHSTEDGDFESGSGVSKPLLASGSSSAGSLNSSAADGGESGGAAEGEHEGLLNPDTITDDDFCGSDTIKEMPSWWPACCGERTALYSTQGWLWSTVVLAVVCIVLQVLLVADPQALDG